MMKIPTALFCLCALFGLAARAQPTVRPEFSFVRHGDRVDLENDLADAVSRQVETVYSTCALNSRRSGYVKPRDDLRELWDRLLLDSSVHLEYPEKVSFRPDIEVTEILQAFPEGNFAGHLLTKGDDELIAYGKCDGLETLRLMCMEGLAEHLPNGYRANCPIVERVDSGSVEVQMVPREPR